MIKQTNLITKQKKKLPLSSDIVFKRVFSKEGNEEILKALLEAILDINIKSVIVKNPEMPKDLYDSKAGVMDIKVEVDTNTIVDIEMQVKDQNNIEERSTFYLTSTSSETVKSGQNYTTAKKAIAISILNFNHYKRNSYHNIAHMNFEDTKPDEYVDFGYKTEDKIATPGIEIHIIELPKFIKKNPDANKKLDQWLWLIVGREDKIEMAKQENKELKKAADIVDQMSMDEKEWEMYISREKAIINYNSGLSRAKLDGIEEGLKQGIEQGIEKGIKEGLKQGKEQGIHEKNKQIVAQMLKLKLKNETICEIAQITLEELEKIKKELIKNSTENK